MSAQTLERFLARLYSDEPFRAKFAENPFECMRDCNLNDDEMSELTRIDMIGLTFASASYASKRARRKRKAGLIRRLFSWRRRDLS